MRIDKIKLNKNNETYSARIIITNDELNNKNIAISDLKERKENAYVLLADIITTLQNQHNFILEDIKIDIIAYKTFVEIIINKINYEKVLEKNTSIKLLKQKSKQDYTSFVFNKIEDVVDFAKAIKKFKVIKSKLYFYKNNFYLVLPKIIYKNIEIILQDFGYSYYNNFLLEHGEEKIKENALEILRKYY